MVQGRDLLEVKRRRLVKELRSSLKANRDRRNKMRGKLREVYDTLSSAYFSLGPGEVETQIKSTDATWNLDVLPLSFVGTRYPHIKTLSKPEEYADTNLDITLQEAYMEMYDILEELIELAEQETRVERMANQLAKTRRDINILNKEKTDYID